MVSGLIFLLQSAVLVFEIKHLEIRESVGLRWEAAQIRFKRARRHTHTQKEIRGTH